MNAKRLGATIIELLLVIGISAIITGVILLLLFDKGGKDEFESTKIEIVSMIREAQSSASSQIDGVAWGVRFESSTSSSASFQLYSGTYSTSSVRRHGKIPNSVSYTTSTVPSGDAIEISFSQVSGERTGSSTVGIYSLENNSSSTISVSTSGLVSHD